MYKYQLRKIGLSKNIKRSEALAIGRVKAWRDARGITSEFWRYGRIVDQVKLYKSVRLHHRELNALVAQDQHRVEPIEALLPPHIVVLSPSHLLSAAGDGVAARLESTEKMFMGFRDYMMAGGPTGSSPSSPFLYGSGQKITELHFLWQQFETNSKKIMLEYKRCNLLTAGRVPVSATRNPETKRRSCPRRQAVAVGLFPRPSPRLESGPMGVGAVAMEV